MHIVRAAEDADAPEILRLAHSAGVGLTTLPADDLLVRRRIRQMRQAIDTDVDAPRGEKYFFVLENLLTGRLMGVAGVLARVGGFEPFYSYAIERRIHRSEQLGISNEIKALHLKESHIGPSEIGTLFVDPDARGTGAGRLLSLSRFLFMASHPRRFADTVIAEMRGVQDDAGGSPFWEAIGRHFFDMDFASADGHSATDKGFIAELMPRHPIYIPLLPTEARAAVGAVHRHTRPALRLLEREGFVFADEVDIFDGGPMYQAKTAAVRSYAQSVLHPVTEVHADPGGTEDLICNGGLGTYRACLGEVRTTDSGVSISRDVALALKVRLGDPIRWVASRPKAEP